VKLGWHRDRKENPISAPSIHVGALVAAASLWPDLTKRKQQIGRQIGLQTGAGTGHDFMELAVQQANQNQKEHTYEL